MMRSCINEVGPHNRSSHGRMRVGDNYLTNGLKRENSTDKRDSEEESVSEVTTKSHPKPNWKNKMVLMSSRNIIVLGILLVALVFLTIGLILGILLTTAEANEVTDGEGCLAKDSKFTCHHTEKTGPYRFYGTKTAYHVARNFLKNDSTTYVPSNCEPLFFYMISRHATRYPDEKYILEFAEKLPGLQAKILSAHAARRGKMCNYDIAQLRLWKLRMVPSDDNRISGTGRVETMEIAKRYKQRFPSVLGKSYAPEDFVLGFTSRNRTLSTLKAFADGLFGEKVANDIDFSQPEDDLLQFHKECKDKMKESGIDVKSDHQEVIRFHNSKLISDVYARVSEKIGFFVGKDDVNMIRRACVFEFSLYGDSPWCSLFEDEDMKVFEYGEDLDDYYDDGYGNYVNYQQACPVIGDLVKQLDSYKTNKRPSVVLRFSHAGAMKKIISRFGLYRDEEPLLADDFCNQVNRKWRSSLICPFTSNFVVVLYVCDGKEVRIGSFLQEEPVVPEGCSQHLCAFDEFMARYDPIKEKCDLDHICS